MCSLIRSLYTAAKSVLTDASDSSDRSPFIGLRERLADDAPIHTIKARSLPVVDGWLETAMAVENERWPELSAAARAGLPELRWQVSYQNLPPSPGLASFQNDYSWAPLVLDSDESPIRLDRALIGFTLQAPGITYPGHHHKPVEIYGVLSGAVEWQVNGGDWELKQPGDVIVHRSHELHAMRTLDEPCLTWVAWDDRNDDPVYMPSLDPPDQTMAPISY